MTIYTTEGLLSSEKKDLIGSEVEVEVECPEKKALAKDDCDVEFAVYNDPVVPIHVTRQSRPAKRRICLQLWLFAGIVVGLSVSMLASLYLYRSMHRLRFRGRCGVTVAMSNRNYTDTVSASALTQQALPQTMEEDVDIDDQVETIAVPQTDLYRKATFKHDFDQNMTAVMDDAASLCYLLPMLSREVIPDPRDFYDTLMGMQDGLLPEYPDVSYQYLISEAYDDLQESVRELCGDYPSYYGTLTGTTTTSSTTPPSIDEMTADYGFISERFFREFAGGNSIVNYRILIGGH